MVAYHNSAVPAFGEELLFEFGHHLRIKIAIDRVRVSQAYVKKIFSLDPDIGFGQVRLDRRDQVRHRLVFYPDKVGLRIFPGEGAEQGRLAAAQFINHRLSGQLQVGHDLIDRLRPGRYERRVAAEEEIKELFRHDQEKSDNETQKNDRRHNNMLFLEDVLSLGIEPR